MSTSEQQARECERLAEQDVDQRVQHLCEAGEYWHMAGDDERARELFERAVAEDGHAAGDERVAYARFLVDTGEVEHARQLLGQVWRSRDVDGATYHAAGELYQHELRELTTAMRWYTSGIVRLAGPDASGGAQQDIWIELLMRARRAVRRELGEPTDEWDELWDTAARSAGALRTDDSEVPDSVGAGPLGRNDPCSCGSGLKYKKCCGAPGKA